MQPPFSSPVPTWHNDTYAAISPQRAELSSVEKTVIITGAGSGIGREIATAFATAGAKCLVLIGRTDSALTETKKSLHAINNSVRCLNFCANVVDNKAMHHIAAEVGTWDVLILNAGYLPNPTPIASASLSDYWAAYKTNVKSVIIAASAFLPTANKAHATMLGVTSRTLVFPPAAMPGLSAYVISKLAMVKMLEYLAAENPKVFVASVHPGIVDTEIHRKAWGKPHTIPMDSATLPAHFILWLSSPEVAFLRGKFVWANWDVDELKAVKEKIQESSLYTVGLGGWPFAQIT